MYFCAECGERLPRYLSEICESCSEGHVEARQATVAYLLSTLIPTRVSSGNQSINNPNSGGAEGGDL